VIEQQNLRSVYLPARLTGLEDRKENIGPDFLRRFIVDLILTSFSQSGREYIVQNPDPAPTGSPIPTREISAMGPAKQEKYGQQLLEICAQSSFTQ
jgi:hypothetical protein